MMTPMPTSRPRSSGLLLIVVSLSLAVGVGLKTMRASDNIDFVINGPIYDTVWDSRLFDGTPGFPGALVWYHNPAGMPGNFTQESFQASIEASFNTWESVDNGIPEEPLVPIVNFGGQSAAADAFTLDGVNLVAWQPEFPGGTLAMTPCWALDLPTTTTTDAMGNTVLPIDAGASIPFPGPPGVTYPIGTVIECGMQFDSADPWSTTAVPDPNAFDVQGIATHEGGHFIGVSHSTLGDFTGINAMSATMLPLVAPGDSTFRTLEEDDRAAVLRIYARNRFNGAIPQTVGGRGVITLTLLKDGACVPATGVSVVAYRTQGGINGTNRVETFSGSQLRAFTPHQPFNGSVTLNVPPLPAGESYTIYARTLETGGGAFAAGRYNYTTINSNLLDPENHGRTFDQLATISSLAAGQSIDLGNVGILDCWVPNPSSQINLVAQSVTAPATGYNGGQIPVSSTFSNQGTVAAGAFAAGIYFSTDQTITASDVFSGFACAVPSLAAGTVAACNGSVPIPPLVPGNYYVGLLVDRQNQVIESGESDNGVATVAPTSIAPNPLDPIVNGSFETGDLTGWTVKELTPKSNPSLPLSVHPAGVEYPDSTFWAYPYFIFLDYFTSAPTDGQYAALHDFNGDDPATPAATFINRRELYQDITLPASTTTLEFDYRAAWELFRFGNTQPRTFSVEIEPAGGGATLLSQTILVAPIDTYEEDTENPSGGVGDYPPAVIDLSSLASQSVRLKFVWNVSEPGTGFGFFQLDNIRLNTSSTPNVAPSVTISSPADGSTSTAGQLVTFAGGATDFEDGNISASLVWKDGANTIGSGSTFSTSALTVGTHTITASVTDSGGLSGSASITVTVNPAANTAPTVTITAPANGSSSTVGQAVTFIATALDTQDGNIAANISWSSSLDGPIGSGGSISTGTLTVGTHTITASVLDSGGLPGSASIAFTVNSASTNTAPTVSISAPAADSTFLRGSSITFTGAASDGQDGNLSGALSWSSNRDGVIGSGASFSTTALSGGSHVITASVTDTGGLPGSATVSIVVNIDNLAAADVSTAPGTRAGSFQQTWTDDDGYETLTEALQGGNPKNRRSLLDHRWRFEVVAGTQYVFKVSAHRSGSEDNFVFSYSRDNVSYTPMVTVTAMSDTDAVQTFTFPQDIAGTVYVRVQDTDSTAGNTQLDSLFVDFLAITTMMQGSGGGGGGGGITLSATGFKVKGLQQVELTWSGATAASVTIGRNGMVIATWPNPGPAGGTYVDNIGVKGAGTYTYQVCETGSGGACSNIATVTF